jgi:hypothetical protein
MHKAHAPLSTVAQLTSRTSETLCYTCCVHNTCNTSHNLEPYLKQYASSWRSLRTSFQSTNGLHTGCTPLLGAFRISVMQQLLYKRAVYVNGVEKTGIQKFCNEAAGHYSNDHTAHGHHHSNALLTH